MNIGPSNYRSAGAPDLGNHLNVKDPTNYCVKILLIYTNANIELQNCEIFTHVSFKRLINPRIRNRNLNQIYA